MGRRTLKLISEINYTRESNRYKASIVVNTLFRMRTLYSVWITTPPSNRPPWSCILTFLFHLCVKIQPGTQLWKCSTSLVTLVQCSRLLLIWHTKKWISLFSNSETGKRPAETYLMSNCFRFLFFQANLSRIVSFTYYRQKVTRSSGYISKTNSRFSKLLKTTSFLTDKLKFSFITNIGNLS